MGSAQRRGDPTHLRHACLPAAPRRNPAVRLSPNSATSSRLRRSAFSLATSLTAALWSGHQDGSITPCCTHLGSCRGGRGGTAGGSGPGSWAGGRAGGGGDGGTKRVFAGGGCL